MQLDAFIGKIVRRGSEMWVIWFSGYGGIGLQVGKDDLGGLFQT